MQQYENLKVYIRTEKGRTVCMCLKAHKLCPRSCDTDVVARDKFMSWQSTMLRDKYGR